MSQVTYKEGDLVYFPGRSHIGYHFYVYEIKGTKLTLVPQDNLDWENGILKLTDAFQVDASKVRQLNNEDN